MTTVSDALLSVAEEGGDPEEADLLDWEEQEWELAQRIITSGRMEALPTKFDVHEWSIMQDFCNSVQSDKVREELLDAIHGAGAFRNFKHAIRRRGLEGDWYAFRTAALRQIAIDWCAEREIVLQ